MRRIDLPYFNERDDVIDSIIIHCMAYDVQDAVESLKQKEVSAHYLIDEKGKIYRLVDEKKRAWHAGQSFWKGKESLNGCSVGIELCSKSLGQQTYPFVQISALVRLCQQLKRKYHIKKERILGHSDIAPTRKPDPGKAFVWKYLARRGLGVWYDLKNAEKIKTDDDNELLKKIGYDISNLTAAKWAFIRHFMPEYVKDDTIENLLQKPYSDRIDVDQTLFNQTLRAVCFAYNNKD